MRLSAAQQGAQGEQFLRLPPADHGCKSVRRRSRPGLCSRRFAPVCRVNLCQVPLSRSPQRAIGLTSVNGRCRRYQPRGLAPHRGAGPVRLCASSTTIFPQSARGRRTGPFLAMLDGPTLVSTVPNDGRASVRGHEVPARPPREEPRTWCRVVCGAPPLIRTKSGRAQSAPQRYPKASAVGEAPEIRRNGPENRPNETILPKARNHPETDGEYLFDPQRRHSPPGGSDEPLHSFS